MDSKLSLNINRDEDEKEVTIYPWDHDLDPKVLSAIFNSFPKPNWNKLLTDKIEKLGYGKLSGACFGYSLTASQVFWVSVLNNKGSALNEFLDRLVIIQKEAQMKTSLTDTSHTPKSSSLGFFDSLYLRHINQFKGDHLEIIKGMATESEIQEKLDALLLPALMDPIREQCKRRVCGEITNIYSSSNVKDFLDTLVHYLGDIPFELRLDCGYHEITLCFCKTQQDWLLFDINKNPMRIYNKREQGLLAEELMTSLFANEERAIIHTLFYTVTPFDNKMKLALEKMKNETRLFDLDLKEKVHTRNLGGLTIFAIASDNKHFSILPKLIEQGADIDEQIGDRRVTSLYLATVNHAIDTMKVLLEQGANPNMGSTYKGIAPLMEAVDQNSIELVRLLLDYGADPLQSRKDKMENALDMATHKGFYEIEILLEKSLDQGKKP